MKGMQAALHVLERDAGRDRDAPGQSWKARPLDLDLLFVVEDGAVPSDALPREPWIRPLVLELLQHLNIDCPDATDPPALAISFEVAGRALGPGAATLSLDPA